MQTGGSGGSGNGGGTAGAASYRALRARHQNGVMGEINVTPLVDVVLVLLLVFMVTAPMMSRGIDVSLPVANITTIAPEDRVAVSIRADGRVYLGEHLMTLPMLEDQLRSMMETRGSKVVYLRADEGLRYGKVIEVVDVIKKAGVEQVGFVYILPGEARQK